MPDTKKTGNIGAADAEVKTEAVDMKSAAEVKSNGQDDKGKAKVLVYIGPTIPRVCIKGNTFNNGLPRKLEDMLKKVPALNELVVPAAGLSKALKELKTPESYLSTVYKHVEGELMK